MTFCSRDIQHHDIQQNITYQNDILQNTKYRNDIEKYDIQQNHIKQNDPHRDIMYTLTEWQNIDY
jgi:hypothetical protein